jgi:outer membrane protein assembly factor BamB
MGSAVYGTDPFNGLIYDVRVWNVPRSLSEIQGFMYATLTGTEPGLVALCNFVGCDPAQPSTMIPVNRVGGVIGASRGNAQVVQAVVPQPDAPTSVWTYPTSGIAPLGPVLTSQGLIYAENVTASGNRPAGNYLHSLDVQTNELNWSYSAHDFTKLPSPVIPATVAVGDGVAYVGAQATLSSVGTFVELHAVDLQTGEAVWTRPATLGGRNFNSRPVVADGKIVVGLNIIGSLQGDPYAGLYWMDAATGQGVGGWVPADIPADSMTDPVVEGERRTYGESTLATASLC